MLAGPQKQIDFPKEMKKMLLINGEGLLNIDFFLGYISAYIQELSDKKQLFLLRDKLENINSIKRDKIINQTNMVELVQASIVQSLEGSHKKNGKKGISLDKFFSSLDENLNELAIDSKYLSKRYYHPQSEYQLPSSVKKSPSKLGLQCPICCEQITHETVCPVACGHNLHKACFQEYFKTQVTVKKFPILCPEEGCGKQIDVSDIQEYISGEALEKYFQFSLHEFVDKNKKANWCPTPGCAAIFEGDGLLDQYNCPTCKKSYCLKCQSEFHVNLTCEQYREMMNLKPEDKEFLNFVKGAQYKQCPSCKFWVSKNEGCDHMTCRCGYQFCYKCGAQYGTCECMSDISDYDDDDDYYEEEEERINRRGRIEMLREEELSDEQF